MKVLMTGMSPPQCGRYTMTGYEHVSDLWAKALLAGGAEVHHRRVEPDVDLTDYDVALIGLVPPNSIAARYMYTAFDVIYRAKAAGCGLLFYVDDWRFNAVPRGTKVVANNPTKRLKESTVFEKLWRREWGLGDGWPRVVKVLETMRDHPWPTTLVPAFTWGVDEIMPSLPTQRRVILDPSNFAREYDIPRVHPLDRRKAWVLGTFSDQREWQTSQGLTWPADYIGTRRSRADRQLKEPELVKLYGEAWGVLAAPYDHSGSGWWRNRFVYSAAAGAVMLSDKRETQGLPDFYRPAHEIEAMGANELAAFGDWQKYLMEKSYEPAEQVTERLLEHCQWAKNLTQGSTFQENISGEAVA